MGCIDQPLASLRSRACTFTYLSVATGHELFLDPVDREELLQRLGRVLALVVCLQLRHSRRRERERPLAVAVHEVGGVRVYDLAVRGEHHQARDALDLEPLAEALLALEVAKRHGRPRHGAVEPLERRPVLVARHQDHLEAGAAPLELLVRRGQHRGEGLAFRVPVRSEVEADDLAIELCKVHLSRKTSSML